jgi:hypothetical protein
MTELQAIMDDHQVSTKESSAKSKHKADIEDEAGKELRWVERPICYAVRNSEACRVFCLELDQGAQKEVAGR